MFRRVILSAVVVNVVQIALVVAHYRAHYLVPAILYNGFVNAVVVAHYSGRLRQGAYIPVTVCCVIAAMLGMVRTGIRSVDWAEGQRSERTGYATLLGKLKAMPE